MSETYRDSNRPIAERIEDLLAQMTLEEKIGQLVQIDGRGENILDDARRMHVGSILCVVGDDIAAPQQQALASRLGIPLLVGVDAIHGHSFCFGATIFPTQLAMSCCWNEALMTGAARATAEEVCYTGIHQTFSPVCCLPRDLRWGRVNETFGEDPLLIGRFASAMVRGYQGDDLRDPRALAACVKHFAGYGETIGGRDSAEGEHSRRKMLSYFLPPFQAAVQAGAASLMTAYQAIDGIPCTANHWLLTEILRTAWGFDGMVVTDWNNVGQLHTGQRISPTMQDAAYRAVTAGNDMMMATPEFYASALAEAQSGHLPIETVDEAVRRILRLKFRLGLFENPRLPDKTAAARELGTPAHRELALQAARESAVLLKNIGILPLDPQKTRRIAVIGPNADNAQEQLGDWSLGASQQTQGWMAQHPRRATVTVLDGIRKQFGAGAVIDYAEGCGVTSAHLEKIAQAVRLAENADVAVLVVGDQDALAGEFKSTATLELMGGQQALFDALLATGTPVVVILLASKPLAIPRIAANADALLCVFNPGMEGGTAIAEILAGIINPSGKLTISFPHHVGQLPVCYFQPGNVHGGGYPDLPAAKNFAPLFPFGFGLSYTKFRYRNLRLMATEIRAGDAVEAEVEVMNTGERRGTEIVQCYLHDDFTSATWPAKLLKDYQRVTLDCGEREIVRFSIPYEALSIVDAECQRVVEAVDFELMVGGSSRDEDLLKVKFTVA